MSPIEEQNTETISYLRSLQRLYSHSITKWIVRFLFVIAPFVGYVVGVSSGTYSLINSNHLAINGLEDRTSSLEEGFDKLIDIGCYTVRIVRDNHPTPEDLPKPCQL